MLGEEVNEGISMFIPQFCDLENDSQLDRLIQEVNCSDIHLFSPEERAEIISDMLP